ncbi:UNVERIFIED_CONTAM: putative disease resistance protein RGA3 [Sesamum angustifolium]|uniref:Disease resistance protein RGA3 n=1 Tax=Sesamum angustifolium TaxID=2727405 RepID=A0AAW2N582_9LAMI
MAETVIVATVRVLVEKLVGVAAEGIGGVLGVKNELNKLTKSLDRMKAFLSDADRRQVEETTVKLWLKNLEEVIYEVDNLLDDYNYEILRRKVEIKNQMRRKVWFFFSFSNPFLFRAIIAQNIKDVNMKLEKLDEEADRHGIRKGIVDSAFFVPPVIETDSISVDPVFFGRENDVSDIVNMLVKPNDEVISVVPIVGMGGLGKTSLARSIFKDQKIIQHFDERIWICVSENFDKTKLLKRNSEVLTKGDVQAERQEDILQDLQKKLADGRYLFVLDDLWNDKYWENFKRALLGINSKRGNFIIVTTRSKEVASVVGPKYQYSLNRLSDSDCLDIIKKRAFCEGDEVSIDLELIVRKIACKCGGLPLAANVIGGTLQRIGKDEWGSVSESELLDTNEDAIGVLKVGFDRLPSPLLKKCFAYCSILRKDVEIEKERLIQLWMAEGLVAESDSSDMESLGSRVYDTLLQNFFFQEETLRAIRCNNLRQLPRQLQNLLSLRHFIVENASFTAFQMPLDIGKLTCLRTLKFFNVGQENGRRIKELENLKHLKGEFEIRNLEHVNDQEEAGRACLVKKPNIHKLVLVWSESREDNPLNDGQVLEGLEPHPNIKSLTIKRFSGEKFPLWIINRSVGDARRLDKLIELKLIDCERCKEIPTLGHLPRLKILELVGLKNVKSIGMSFYYPHGGYDESTSTEGGSSQLQAVVLFGALESFRLQNMPNLVEWTEISTYNATRVVNAFPRLESLDISKCPNLSCAPSHGFPSLKDPLTSLELCRVSDLTSLPERLFSNKGRRLSSLKITECPSLTDLELPGDDPAHNSTCLQHLERLYIIDCSNLKSIQYSRPGQSELEDVAGLISLRDLRILNCEMLTDFPSRMLESCTSLGYLMLSNCPNLDSFPVDFRRMPHLYYLEISQCQNLSRIFPIVGPNCLCHLTKLTLDALAKHVSFEDFCRDFQGILGLRSLEDLTLNGNSKWTSLPSQLQHLTALTRLSLSEFGIEELPDWFGNFSSLRTLSLTHMKSLRKFVYTMRVLFKLEDIYVNECWKLMTRWKSTSGTGYAEIYSDPYFPRFRQVLNVYVNGQFLEFDPKAKERWIQRRNESEFL